MVREFDIVADDGEHPEAAWNASAGRNVSQDNDNNGT